MGVTILRNVELLRSVCVLRLEPLQWAKQDSKLYLIVVWLSANGIARSGCLRVPLEGTSGT